MLTKEELEGIVEDQDSLDYYSNEDDDYPLQRQHFNPLSTRFDLGIITCSNFKIGVCKDDCTVDVQWLGFDSSGINIFGMVDLGSYEQETLLMKYCPLSGVVRILKSLDSLRYIFMDFNQLSGNVMFKTNDSVDYTDSLLIYNVTNESETVYICRSSHDYEKFFNLHAHCTVKSTLNGVYVVFNSYRNTFCKIELEDFGHFYTFQFTTEIYLPRQIIANKMRCTLDSNRFLYYSFRDFSEFVALDVETGELSNISFDVPDIIDRPTFRSFHIIGSDSIYGYCQEGLMKITVEGNTCKWELINISLSVDAVNVTQNSTFPNWRFDIRDSHCSLMVNRYDSKLWAIFAKFSKSEYIGLHTEIVGHGRYLHLVAFTVAGIDLNLEKIAVRKFFKCLKDEYRSSLDENFMKVNKLPYPYLKKYV